MIERKDNPMTATETATSTEANEANGTKARPRPVYGAEKVSELPPKLTPDRSGPRTAPALIEAFQIAHGEPGEWFCVGTFQSPNGARTLLKRINKGDVKGVPAGDWEFEVRQVEAADGSDKRWSKLYAKFMG